MYLYIGQQCANQFNKYDEGDGCVDSDPADPPGSIDYVLDPPSGGTCEAQGGNPIGGVDFDNATTVCCTAG